VGSRWEIGVMWTGWPARKAGLLCDYAVTLAWV
jgi:hypothetical protein